MLVKQFAIFTKISSTESKNSQKKEANMKQEQKKHPKDYPEEYVTGTVTFFGREFHVTPDVLIPRLETEGLVRRARKIFGQ